MSQKRMDSAISAFNNLIEDGKIKLSPVDIKKARTLLEEYEKSSAEFRKSKFYLGFDAPLAVINPKMNYRESDLFLVPFSQS